METQDRGLGPCFLWTGIISPAGYGVIYAGEGTKRTYAHRQHWIDNNGPIPKGTVLRHRCDIRHCWRLDHLVPGTQADNVRDMMQRGRQAKGTMRWNAKLTDDTVRRIKKNTEGYNQVQWSQVLGVSDATINLILKGKRWKHVVD